MFVPSIPYSYKNTVINKDIVYSDDFPLIYDRKDDIKVTPVSRVGKYSLEKCLKTIFQENEDVTFYTIQYSEKRQRIYLYTDTTITKDNWEKINAVRKPLTHIDEIAEDVNKILTSEKNKDSDCVSLYDIAKLMKSKEAEYERIKTKYEKLISRVDGWEDRFFVIHDFDYNNHSLGIAVVNYYGMKETEFFKINGDLRIRPSENIKNLNIFVELCDIISKMYDEFIEFEDFAMQSNYNVKPINSNLLTKISHYGVSISASDFVLESYSYKDGYEYTCNSYNLINIFRNQEDEILKRIFIRLDDCPEWSRPILYEIRQKQLLEEMQQEEKEQENIDEEHRERHNKQKKLGFFKRIFSKNKD